MGESYSVNPKQGVVEQSTGNLSESDNSYSYSDWMDVRGKSKVAFYWYVAAAAADTHLKLSIQHVPDKSWVTNGITPGTLPLFANMKTTTVTAFTEATTVHVGSSFVRYADLPAGWVRFRKLLWGTSPSFTHNYSVHGSV
jgi:hypothetical protein